MDEESSLHQTVSLTSGCVVCQMFPYKTESHANKTLMLLGLILDVRPLEHTYLDDRAWKINQLRPIRFVCMYVVDGI